MTIKSARIFRFPEDGEHYLKTKHLSNPFKKRIRSTTISDTIRKTYMIECARTTNTNLASPTLAKYGTPRKNDENIHRSVDAVAHQIGLDATNGAITPDPLINGDPCHTGPPKT